MNDFPNSLKGTLISIIRNMANSMASYVKNPNTDFTRNRKLSFETVMMLIIHMGGNSVYKELLEASGLDPNTATTSAFVQQRDKILISAFETLLQSFTMAHAHTKLFMGYRLIAFDGSDLLIPTDPNDTDTYCNTGSGRKGYNILHLNAMYDLLNRTYCDILVQPCKQNNENKALVNILERSAIAENVIAIADRGYESYNNFAHLEGKGWKFLIRVKDIESKCGILSGLGLTHSGEFDIQVNRILTNKQTKEIMAQPEIYKHISRNSTFDFVDLKKCHFFPISFRVVRIMLENGTYESIITNLDASQFPPAVIKKLYELRWGIETSFRKLKYTIGLTAFHARKREYIIQEIYARTIMYNFAEIITSHVVISRTQSRHSYQVNFTVAVLVCRHFLRLRNNASPPDVEAIIRKNILPVRPNRSFKRPLRNKAAVSFIYRVA
jgi:hypothetical protein